MKNQNNILCSKNIIFNKKKIIYKYFYDKLILQNNKLNIHQIINDKNKFLLIYNNDKKILEKYLYFICLTKNKLLLKLEDYGYFKNQDPFDENTINLNQYFIILKSNNLYTLKDALFKNKINLFSFKILFKEFLKNYSNLNRKTGFVYNNINLESILFDNIKFILYNFKNSIDNNKYKLYNKKNIKNNFIVNKFLKDKNIINNLDKNKNSEIIAIILLINYCERILNKYPIEISLNNDDIKFFNSSNELYEKLNYIIKIDYFKTL